MPSSARQLGVSLAADDGPTLNAGLPSMRGSRNFRQGGPGQSDKKAVTFYFFFSPQRILQKSSG